MKKLFSIMFKRWYFVLLSTLSIITQVYFQLLLPEFTGNIQTIINYKGGSLVEAGTALGATVSLSNPLTNVVTTIDHYLSQNEVTSLILEFGGWMILICVVIFICAIIQHYTAAAVGAYVGKTLRKEMYHKVNTLSLSDYNKFGTATLITRTTNDIEQLKNFIVMFIRIIIMSPTYMIIAISKTLALQSPGPKLALVLVVVIPLILIMMIILFVFVLPLFKEMQVKTDDVTVVERENLTGIRVIRAYNQQETERNKFDKVNTNLKNILVKSGRIMSVANPFMTVIFNFAYILVYGLGFYLLTKTSASSSLELSIAIGNQITIIAVVAQYSTQIMSSFLMLAMILVMFPQASASYQRVYEVLSITSSINDSEARKYAIDMYNLTLQKMEYNFKETYKKNHNGDTFSYSLLKEKYSKMNEIERSKDKDYNDYLDYINIRESRKDKIKAINDLNSDAYIDIINEDFKKKEVKGEIEFKNVSFIYPDSNTPTISNISFKTKKGETTAIIGSTGSGKSTLINLIPRFYDISEGEILLDGIDIKKIPQKVLRNNIGFVPQSAILFSGTIRDNIKFGNESASDEEINKVLEVAQASHFVSNLPDKLDTFVSQGGKNFSGGQKQRLSIARSLIRNPEIYVFDDSFSALDFKTDAMLRSALKTYVKDASIIIVAQRVSSIIDADNIIVMNEGKCVGKGTHQELLKSCKVYQDIVRSQLDPEEVDKTINLVKKMKGEN